MPIRFEYFVLPLAAIGLAACANTAQEATVDEVSAKVDEAPLCLASGPQPPRDISNTTGLNAVSFPMAPPASEMNLCNIHTHTNAEHKGPGFSVFVNATDKGGYACNATADLTAEELRPSDGAYKGVKPGDTIEVHWVHTSCSATPSEGLCFCDQARTIARRT